MTTNENITNDDGAPLKSSPITSGSNNITMENCSKVTMDKNSTNDDRVPLSVKPNNSSNQNITENLTNVEKKSLKLGLSMTKSDKNGSSSSKINREIILPSINDLNHSNIKRKSPPNSKKKSLVSATRDRWQHSITQDDTENPNKI